MANNLKYAALLRNRQQDGITTELGASALVDVIAGTQKASPDVAIGSTTLNGSITNVATTLTVNSFANFPASGNYEILIDSEWMLVTGGQGTLTWTVTRAQRGTSGAAHSNAAAVVDAIVLATLTCNATFAPAASGGVLTLNSITSGTGTAAAGAGTTANYFRMKTSGATPKIDGTVGIGAPGTFDFCLNNTSIATGQTVAATSWTFTNGN